MKLSHTLSVLFLCLPSAWAQSPSGSGGGAQGPPQTGVALFQAKELRYGGGGQPRDTALRDRIRAKLGKALVGSGRTRRAAFVYVDDGIRAAVRGRLLEWENLKVELYRVDGPHERSFSQAIGFAYHHREGEFVIHEVRGRHVLTISGAAAQDTALVLQLRELCWPKGVQERVDMLRRVSAEGDFYIRFSTQAIDTPALSGRDDLRAGYLERYGARAGHFTREGRRERLVLGRYINTLETQLGEFTADGNYSSPASEVLMEEFAAAFFAKAPAEQERKPRNGLEDFVDPRTRH